MHRRAHQAKDLRNVVPSFAHAGRSLLVPVLVALVLACGSEEQSTGPQDVPAVPAPAPADAQATHVNAALGVCPTHRTAWTVKQGGISKAGKPYSAFYKCSGKNDDGSYCSQKPVKAWADSHPIAEEVPF